MYSMLWWCDKGYTRLLLSFIYEYVSYVCMPFASKKPFPAKWGDEGVDVSKDEFVKRWGTQKDHRVHVGANFKTNLPGSDLNTNSPAVKRYICMVGNCSGVGIDKKPKEEEE